MGFKYRNDIILKYIKNKKVLDIWFLWENKSKLFSPLHDFILQHASEVWWVDIDKNRIEELKSKWYKVIFDDVQKLNNLWNLNYKFDVIVAGEIIEHLDNPWLFLEKVKKFLLEDWVLIITTPNMFSLRYIIRHTLFGQETPYWKDRESEIRYGHVIWFSKMLLENLLLRYNYDIVELTYTIKNEYTGFKGNIEKVLSKIFPRFAPSLIAIVK